MTDQPPNHLPPSPFSPTGDPGDPSEGGSVRILVTAGPTWEPIDSVRYVGNRSSGLMGAEIAIAASNLGHHVTLLRGPGAVAPSPGSLIETIRFQTAADLQQALRAHWPSHEVLFMAAAVADFRPRNPDADPSKKRRREDGPFDLALEPVPDLLAEIACLPHPGTRIGFALEPQDGLENRARSKMARKKLDAIVANPLHTMESDRIDGSLLLPDGGTICPPQRSMTKAGFAAWLVPAAVSIHRRRSGPPAH